MQLICMYLIYITSNIYNQVSLPNHLHLTQFLRVNICLKVLLNFSLVLIVYTLKSNCFFYVAKLHDCSKKKIRICISTSETMLLSFFHPHRKLSGTKAGACKQCEGKHFSTASNWCVGVQFKTA